MRVVAGGDLGLGQRQCWLGRRAIGRKLNKKPRIMFAGLDTRHRANQSEGRSCVVNGSAGYITQDGMYTEGCSCALEGEACIT